MVISVVARLRNGIDLPEQDFLSRLSIEARFAGPRLHGRVAAVYREYVCGHCAVLEFNLNTLVSMSGADAWSKCPPESGTSIQWASMPCKD